jgi:hypothetical protein
MTAGRNPYRGPWDPVPRLGPPASGMPPNKFPGPPANRYRKRRLEGRGSRLSLAT